MINQDKKIVFISHANPADNDAALWLASKLALEGYYIWTDLTHLFGGDIFWDNIEDSIRNYTAKFVLLVSKKSQISQGVLDELNIAISLERSKHLTRFVIPIRLDDLPFDEFRANIARINAVDFSTGWADGFPKLLEVLVNDNVPKNPNIHPNIISNWYQDNYLKPTRVHDKPQILSSNWLNITHFPQFINFSRLPVEESKLSELVAKLNYSAFQYGQLIGSFATNTELQSSISNFLIISHAHKINLDDFLEGKTTMLPSLDWKEGQNLISGILRKSWDAEMGKRGLMSYSLSDFTKAWFLPHELVKGNIIKYEDLDGKVRNKKLVGKSEKFQVYWHFALSSRPAFGHPTRFHLTPHVIFTSDGIKPIDSTSRMHTLRRGFCRRWWNDQWRTLLLAYLTFLSNDKEEIQIQVSPSEYVCVNGKPMIFKSPKSIDESDEHEQELSDNQLDEIAGDIDSSDDLDLDELGSDISDNQNENN